MSLREFLILFSAISCGCATLLFFYNSIFGGAKRVFLHEIYMWSDAPPVIKANSEKYANDLCNFTYLLLTLMSQLAALWLEINGTTIIIAEATAKGVGINILLHVVIALCVAILYRSTIRKCKAQLEELHAPPPSTQ